MNNTSKPNKEQVRAWLKHRQSFAGPPPSPEQIRVELGWMLKKEKQANKQR